MFKVGLLHFVFLSLTLFSIGVFGVLWQRRNLLIVLLCIELMLLAANINMVAFARHFGDVTGQLFTLLIFAVAAAESAIGLALFMVYFRLTNGLEIAKSQEEG